MEFFHSTPRFRFMAMRRLCYLISIIVIVGSMVAEGYHGLNLAVDFTGGVVIEAGFSGTADLDRTRAALKTAGYPEVAVQNFGSSKDVLVRLPPLGENPEDRDRAQGRRSECADPPHRGGRSAGR
ncbi:MAG: hypothetical protein NTZ79_12670 [Proteobacteria bacterium]|nr:hypothetical protein [Pseudomonadota bacterium]